MNRYKLLILRLLLVSVIVLNAGFANAQTDVQTFNERRIQITQNGLYSLGTWSLANLGISGGLLLNGRSGQPFYFHRMNIYWNSINLLIAGGAYYMLRKEDYSSYGIRETFKKQFATEKAYLFNTALDLGYVIGGYYLRARADSRPDRFDQLDGFGSSVIIQGAFLFVYDLVVYLIHNRHGNQLFDQVEGLSIGIIPGRAGLTYRF